MTGTSKVGSFASSNLDFERFVYADVATEPNGMELSVLSALSRRDSDRRQTSKSSIYWACYPLIVRGLKKVTAYDRAWPSERFPTEIRASAGALCITKVPSGVASWSLTGPTRARRCWKSSKNPPRVFARLSLRGQAGEGWWDLSATIDGVMMPAN
jgi:hypothetical protein